MTVKTKENQVEEGVNDSSDWKPEVNHSTDTTPSAATLHPASGSASKGDLMQRLVGAAMGMDAEDLSAWLEKSFALIGHEADLVPGGAVNANQNSIKARSTPSITMEELKSLFEGENLSEENAEKFVSLFEASVAAKVAVKVAEAEDNFEKSLEEQVNSLKESLDKYLDYTVSEWMKENQIAVDSALKAEMFEDFMEDLKNVFEQHHIDVPEDKLDVIGSMQNEIDELKEQLNKAINENVSQKDVVENSKKDDVFKAVSEGLTLMDVERFKVLIEGIEFVNEEKYEKALNVIKDKFIVAKLTESKENQILEESFEGTEKVEETVSPEVSPYVDYLNRMIRK